ncbi:hypothetical protein NHQ30_007395 [Ciborinia camelliae]|nr:hypothetical protein NHQ30_007395 [Ciborinia camelliae]
MAHQRICLRLYTTQISVLHGGLIITSFQAAPSMFSGGKLHVGKYANSCYARPLTDDFVSRYKLRTSSILFNLQALKIQEIARTWLLITKTVPRVLLDSVVKATGGAPCTVSTDVPSMTTCRVQSHGVQLVNDRAHELQYQKAEDDFSDGLSIMVENLSIEMPQRQYFVAAHSYGFAYAEASTSSMAVNFNADQETGMHVKLQDITYEQCVMTEAETYARRDYNLLGIGTQFEETRFEN